MQIVRSSLSNMHRIFIAITKCELKIQPSNRACDNACTASLDNCYHLNINVLHLSAVVGHASVFACRWHQTENKDQRQIFISCNKKKSHLLHSLCNAKALGESACSISRLIKRAEFEMRLAQMAGADM